MEHSLTRKKGPRRRTASQRVAVPMHLFCRVPQAEVYSTSFRGWAENLSVSEYPRCLPVLCCIEEVHRSGSLTPLLPVCVKEAVPFIVTHCSNNGYHGHGDATLPLA